MRWRVQNILLVSSLYDSFILAEDDQLGELLLSDFLGLDLRHIPGLTRVSSGADALALARDPARYNLIISSPHIADMNARDLAVEVRRLGLETPVVLLAYDQRELSEFVERHDVSDIELAFLWQGDANILLAIVKCIEDRMNAACDVGEMGVQAIIVIEDQVRFYSSFLPLMYRELMDQARRLVPEGINLAHRLMRVQARPKILLCATFEEAWADFTAWHENVLGVISDVEFPRGGRLDPGAGVAFARAVRHLQPDVPIVLQSALPENEAMAREAGAAFLLKGSPTLLAELRRLMIDSFGFGDFVFRLPDGTEVGRAGDLRALETLLRTVPAASIAYHAERNHFSNWLKARTEFSLAHSLRPRKVSDFPTLEHLRHDLIESIRLYQRHRRRGTTADFDPATFDPETSFARLGGGSLGGKARGLAFVNALLDQHGVREAFAGVRISVPAAVVLGTDWYDQLLSGGDLRDFAIGADEDAEIVRRFLEAPLPPRLREQLATFLGLAGYPLAVRSSSLLEDSQYQPFAGVYDTFMLANDHPFLDVRQAALEAAIKRVYASTFLRRAKAYLQATSYRLEEEKMGVILQRVVGAARGPRFYPDIAGVVRSHNFYPTPPMKPEDGIAAAALGLGAAVVDGELCVRFCPRYPQRLAQLASPRDYLRNTQREFHALHLAGASARDDGASIGTFDLAQAEADGALAWVGSTYSRENDTIYDGISRPGPRLVTFAPILKQGRFPLSEILERLVGLGVEGTSAPVEVEFAANLSVPAGRPREFGFLQLRPLAVLREGVAIEHDGFERERLICRSDLVLGNGQVDDLRDLVVVDYHRFDRARSSEVAREVAGFNASLLHEGRTYLLVGVGRWGSSEPRLGIPVTWDQISGARVIVEAGFRDFVVAPSQGSHFFQNLAARSVGYFTVNPEAGQGFVDWEWLADQPARREAGCVRHLRFERPLVVRMNGRRNAGVILKPGP